MEYSAEELSKQFIRKYFCFIKNSINNNADYLYSFERRDDFVKLCTALGVSVEVIDGIIQ